MSGHRVEWVEPPDIAIDQTGHLWAIHADGRVTDAHGPHPLARLSGLAALGAWLTLHGQWCQLTDAQRRGLFHPEALTTRPRKRLVQLGLLDGGGLTDGGMALRCWAAAREDAGRWAA